MIIFRTKSTTFGRGIWRQPFWRFPGVLAPPRPQLAQGLLCPANQRENNFGQAGGQPGSRASQSARQPGSRPAEPIPGSFLGIINRRDSASQAGGQPGSSRFWAGLSGRALFFIPDESWSSFASKVRQGPFRAILARILPEMWPAQDWPAT